MPKTLVDLRSEDTVPIVDDEAIGMIARQCFPELLQRPFRCGMVSDIVVENLPRFDLHDDEDVEGTECGGDHHEEVAGHHDLGMVADKGQPALFWVRRAPWNVSMQVLADGARGDLNGQLELQLIANAFLSPGRILCGHPPDESGQILGDLRSAHRPGFPAPEETESLAVPAKEGIGLDVHQGVTPTEHAPQNDHNQPCGIVGAWRGLTLRCWNKASCLRRKRFSAAGARRDRETSTRRRTRSHATKDSVLRLCVSSWKMEPGMTLSFTRYATLRDCQLAARRNFCGPRWPRPSPT